jgi:hypothetical protein
MDNKTQITWTDKVKDLPRTLDRFRAASIFFDIKYPTFLCASIDARKWTSWASLSAIASIPEIVEYDFEEIGLSKEWRKSVEFQDIRNNKILAVLKELRNYEVHIEYQVRKSHVDIDKIYVKESLDHNSFFFSPIDWMKFQKLKNIRSGRSVVDQAAILDFNSHSQCYSVETIVDQALEFLAEKIHFFLENH